MNIKATKLELMKEALADKIVNFLCKKSSNFAFAVAHHATEQVDVAYKEGFIKGFNEALPIDASKGNYTPVTASKNGPMVIKAERPY